MAFIYRTPAINVERSVERLSEKQILGNCAHANRAIIARVAKARPKITVTNIRDMRQTKTFLPPRVELGTSRCALLNE